MSKRTVRKNRRPPLPPPVDVENLAACIHTALRKGVDTRAASRIYSAIADSEDDTWGVAVRVGCEWAGLSKRFRLQPADGRAVPLYEAPERRARPLGQRVSKTDDAARDATYREIVLLVGKLAEAERELRHLRGRLKAAREALGPDEPETSRRKD